VAYAAGVGRILRWGGAALLAAALVAGTAVGAYALEGATVGRTVSGLGNYENHATYCTLRDSRLTVFDNELRPDSITIYFAAAGALPALDVAYNMHNSTDVANVKAAMNGKRPIDQVRMCWEGDN
jgi:hypothetical protein